jgi:hypothetical protein
MTPAPTVIIPLVPVSEEGAELVLYGAVRELVLTIRRDDEHKPARGERQRWLLIIDQPIPAERT